MPISRAPKHRFDAWKLLFYKAKSTLLKATIKNTCSYDVLLHILIKLFFTFKILFHEFWLSKKLPLKKHKYTKCISVRHKQNWNIVPSNTYKQLFKISLYYKITHMLNISLSSLCALFRSSFQSLFGSVARHTHSSDLEMQILNSTQYDGN